MKHHKDISKRPLFWLTTILVGVLFFQITAIVRGQIGNPPNDAGQVLRIGTDGALVIATTTITNVAVGGNNNLSINPIGNLGIAVPNPEEKLDVGGNVQAISFIGNWAGSGIPASRIAAGLFGEDTGLGNFAFPAYLGVATSSPDGLPQALSVYGGGYFKNYVGIGTSTPLAPLHVAGTIKLGTVLDFSGSSGNITTAQGTALNIKSSDILSLFVSGSLEAIRILTNGNVGVATTTPSYKLDVWNGDINTSGDYRKSGTAGISRTCPAGQTVATTTVSGGIITGGTCAPIGSGAPTDASYVVMDYNGTLSGERKLTPGLGITITDGGADGAVTITALDISPTNEIQGVITDGGLRTVSNNFGLLNCDPDEIVKVDASGLWRCATDATGDSLPSGASGQTLRYSTSWMADSNIYNTGANVGIGTIGLDTNYRITTNGGIKVKGSTSDATRYAAYFENLASNVLLAVRNDGNVGIGMTPGAYKLDVGGDINTSGVYRVDGTAGVASQVCSAGQFPNALTITGGIITVAGSCTAFGTITNITAGAGLTGGGITGSVNLDIGAGTGITVAADTVGIAYSSLSCPNADESLKTINLGTGVVTCEVDDAGGGVGGSGTTNYAAYWSGTNTLAGEQYLDLTRGGTDANLSTVATGGLIYKGALALAGTDALTGILRGTGAGAPTAIVGTDNYLAKWTSGGTALTSSLIYSSTNVGIGTPGPDAKLHVIGSICAESSDTGCAPTSGYVRGLGLCIGTDCRTSWPGGIGGSITIGQVAFGTAVNTIGGNNNLYWDSTNNRLGIGTAGSLSKLSLGGVANFNNRIALYETIATDFRGIGMANPSAGVFGVGIWANKSPSDINMDLFVKDGGNVGVGTTTPNEKLEVAGNIHLSGGDRTIFNRSNNYLAFGTNNAQRMRITSDGNVGIGTTNPQAKLVVKGTIVSERGVIANGQVSCADGFNLFNSYFECLNPRVKVPIGGSAPITKAVMYNSVDGRNAICLALGGSSEYLTSSGGSSGVYYFNGTEWVEAGGTFLSIYQMWCNY